MPAFTPTQGRYLVFIHQYIQLHGGAPAELEIAQAMCVMPPSVNQMVRSLMFLSPMGCGRNPRWVHVCPFVVFTRKKAGCPLNT